MGLELRILLRTFVERKGKTKDYLFVATEFIENAHALPRLSAKHFWCLTVLFTATSPNFRNSPQEQSRWDWNSVFCSKFLLSKMIWQRTTFLLHRYLLRMPMRCRNYPPNICDASQYCSLPLHPIFRIVHGNNRSGVENQYFAPNLCWAKRKDKGLSLWRNGIYWECPCAAASIRQIFVIPHSIVHCHLTQFLE